MQVKHRWINRYKVHIQNLNHCSSAVKSKEQVKAERALTRYMFHDFVEYLKFAYLLLIKSQLILLICYAFNNLNQFKNI